MRFSIRWLLAVTAYIALLAAAVGSGSEVLVDVVWAVPILAFCYAVVVACIDRGERRATAIGFVALSAAHVVCMYLAPDKVPARRLYSASGYSVRNVGTIYEPTGETEIPNYKGARPQAVYQKATGLVPTVRTSNGVATLGAGLIGCLIGLLSYRHTDRS